MTFSKILKSSTDLKTILGERTLRTSVNDLKEQLTHSSIDGIANKVCVQCLHYCKTRKNLSSHSCGMCHTGAADCLYECLLNDTILNIQRHLAGTLLRCAPAYAVCESGNVFDLFRLNPFCFFRNRSSAMMYALMYNAHIFYFL